MPTGWTWRFVQFLLLACIASPQHVQGSFVATTSSSSVNDRISTTVRVPTCHAVSVNYVSPGLPQQCLRTRSTSVSETTPSGTGATSLPNMSSNTVNTTAPSTPTSVVSSEHIESISANSSDAGPPTSSTYVPHKSAEPVENVVPEDSPLDTAKFLSFEEWKVQNLAKVGQSSESFAQRGMREPRKAPGSGNAALDGLGWEMALEFGDGSPDDSIPEKVVQVSADPKATEPSPTTAPIHRSPDAGKTCKERFNYASFDCAATVHKHNKEGKGSNSILVENKESYMLNKCEAKEKFFIVELCDDILVDTVVLANFEFFSSVFKELRVSVSDRYPVKANGWRELGTFVARNTRDVQAFLIENPLIWARYIKVDLLSHYGNEYYCPLSLFRVHGTTMMEEFRHQVEAPRADADIREDIVAEAVAEVMSETKPVKVDKEGPSNARETSVHADTHVKVTSTTANDPISRSSKPARAFVPRHSPNPRLVFSTKPLVCHIDATEITMSDPETAGSAITSMQSPTSDPVGQVDLSSNTAQAHISAPSNNISTAVTVSSATPSTKLEPRPVSSVTKTTDSISQDLRPSASHPPPIANPTTQESFFKSVHKRLTHLEGNSTLSLQYIEEQSRILRDAFAQMEKKQLARVDQVLKTLNLTAFADLRNYREKYDQLWQSTVIALEGQREYTEREMGAISSRLSLLADEVIFQKRMYQLNTVLLLITIGIVLFSRNEQLAMPLVQHLRTRSSVRIFDSPPNSPPLRSSRPSHHRMNSSDSASSMISPVVQYSPPTPVEYASQEASPIIESKSSPSTPVGGRGSRKGWIPFGGPLRVETRQFQRHPSPLRSVGNEDTDEVSETSSSEHKVPTDAR